ncbi:MAG TPA: hypothetical protein VFS94_01505 [Gemmatimonadales bacterium]|nr:hypothetical protein [Gemmatimonadales bacterium]
MTTDPAPVLADLIERHQEPGRHYHTLHHVNSVLDQLEAVRGALQHPAETELAVWFHDAVYDPTRRDNEEQSAALALGHLERAGAPETQVARIAGIILDTRHQHEATSPDGALVADADLTILAAEPDEFDAYEAAIRREYGHLTDAEFRMGRRQFVEAMLQRPRIYQTPCFSQLERRARLNLQKSLAGARLGAS